MINANFSQLTKSNKSVDYVTPPEFFNKLNKIFNFEIDAATSKENPLKLPRFFTKTEDALEQEWDGNTFCNPPFGKLLGLPKWIAKMKKESMKHTEHVYCMLLPARTETLWANDIVRIQNTYIHFIRGRLTFVNPVLNKNRNPHIMGSMLWILGATLTQIFYLSKSVSGFCMRTDDIVV